jgi:hypothetical protein
MPQMDHVRLENLVSEAIKIAKWDADSNIGHDPAILFLRFEFLAHEILSLSGKSEELIALRSSQHLHIVERALSSLKKAGKFDADSILQALTAEIDAIRRQPPRKYWVAWPIAVSADLFIKTPKKYMVDQNSVVVLTFLQFGAKYFPKKIIQGRKVADAGFLKDTGFSRVGSSHDLSWLMIGGPLFLVSEVFARDSCQAVSISGNSIELFLSAADLASGFTLLERYPLSSYLDPTFCFVFEKLETVPQSFGRWVGPDWLPSYVFNPPSISQVLKLLNSLRKSDSWPVIRSSLVAFRRAMCQTKREEVLINLWTACEILAAAGDRQIRDEDAAKTMKKVFKATWFEFSEQVDSFLDARNSIIHESSSSLRWSDIYFAHFLFERLISLVLGYSRKGKNLADIRAIFAAAKLDATQANRMLAALQELQASPASQ